MRRRSGSAEDDRARRVLRTGLVIGLVLIVGGAAFAAGQLTASTTPPSTTRSTPARGQQVAPFVGIWDAHGIAMTVSRSGAGTATWRTYTWCAPKVHGPCDSNNDGAIVDGGAASFGLQSVTAKGTAVVTASSNQPSVFPGGTINLSLIANDEIAVTSPTSRVVLVLCGRSAPSACRGA